MVRTQTSHLGCAVLACDRKQGVLSASHGLPAICSVTGSCRAPRNRNLDLLAAGQRACSLSGSGQADPGASRTVQHQRGCFRYAQLSGEALPCSYCKQPLQRLSCTLVTSFSRLGQQECLHRAVKTRRCECPTTAAPRMLATALESSFASSAPAERFHGRKSLLSAHGMALFALQIALFFPMAAAQRQGSVFLWEGNKLLHHCDLCAVSC